MFNAVNFMFNAANYMFSAVNDIFNEVNYILNAVNCTFNAVNYMFYTVNLSMLNSSFQSITKCAICKLNLLFNSSRQHCYIYKKIEVVL